MSGCPGRIEDVTCALPWDGHTEHARGFLMWTDDGAWWSCRVYGPDGRYILPGDPQWNG